MIPAIIIDDEQSCISRLSGLLESHCADTIRLTGSADSVERGIRLIQDAQPGLVFLDVQIGEETGFDLLRRLKDVTFEVVFTTAYEKYAMQAIKFSAADYLLKPVDPDDLVHAVEKLKARMSKEETAQKLDVLFHNLRTLEGASKKISVPTISGLEFLQVSDIIRCESDVNYTNIYVKGRQKLTVAKTLKEFEELLTDYNFFRVHNSHLINLSHIKKYNKGSGGYITMTDNSEVEVSTRRKDEFLKRIAEL
ncbi:MAG: response regulator transcription factor [Bacteroidetes bacterium]|nr:response regulator transcription factor [Bacteroidota bacterium]MCW5894273.1 response regulator transcription factor [Bacteroidota bacterium]